MYFVIIAFIIGSCGHGRAPAYFIESVFSTDKKFIGLECEDYDKFENGECQGSKSVEMGHHTPHK